MLTIMVLQSGNNKQVNKMKVIKTEAQLDAAITAIKAKMTAAMEDVCAFAEHEGIANLATIHLHMKHPLNSNQRISATVSEDQRADVHLLAAGLGLTHRLCKPDIHSEDFNPVRVIKRMASVADDLDLGELESFISAVKAAKEIYATASSIPANIAHEIAQQALKKARARTSS